VHSAPEGAVVVVDDPPSSPDSPRPTATAAPGAGAPAATASTPRTTAVPNSRKGYKLTLVVSAISEAGLADAHGMLQLDGADPVPFCRLKNVQNPLARALQEAFLAVERVRAKPPKMVTPTVITPPAPVGTARPAPHPRPTSSAQQSPGQPAAAPPTRPAGPPVPPKQAAPVGQPTLF
jgi:hypothetical protein